MSNSIVQISIESKVLPLSKPYVLSFATLDHFESIVVSMLFSDGIETHGEVVPLFGYSDEDSSSIKSYLESKSKELIDLDVRTARQIIEKDIDKIPFSTSALLTAIDLYLNPLELVEDLDSFEYVIPTSTENIEELIQKHDSVCLQQNRMIKVKLSGNPKTDIKGLKAIERELIPGKSRLRLDANQGYSLDDGLEFFAYLDSIKHKECIQYVEQPYHVSNWEYNRRTIADFPEIPIMLDESIVTTEHILLAKDLGVRIVKLKLYKQGGITELLECAQFANTEGFTVVLGNGVAGRLTNQVETTVYQSNRNLFDPVLESNGYKKLR